MMAVDAHSPVGSRVASSNHHSAAGAGRLSVGGNGIARSSQPSGDIAVGNEAVSPESAVGSRTTASVSSVLAVKPPVLPSSPPAVVQQWLRREDWEALSNAWAVAEAQAIAWEEGELDDSAEDLFDDDFDESWRDVDVGASQSILSRASTASPTLSSSEARPSKSQRKPWNEDFHLIGQDSRKPAPLRRYFDSLPSETSPKREPVRPGLRPQAGMMRAEDASGPDTQTEPWNHAFGSMASTDNDGLHPHLRHYFDRRGIESTYKMRPHCDHKWLQALPARTPGRPSTREKLLRLSSSEPALGGSLLTHKGSDDKLDVKARGVGSIPWGQRCLLFGPNGNVKRGPVGEKIPWVSDHGIIETDDNEILHPMLRHYFDAEGIESCFRNRGRHYGRPTKMCFGIPPIEHKHRLPKPASKKASHGQLPLSVDQGDTNFSPKSVAGIKRLEDLPSPSGRLVERRRSSTATIKDALSRPRGRRRQSSDQVPNVADTGSLASTGSGEKLAGTATSDTFTFAASPEAAAGEQLAATADFGLPSGAHSPSSRLHDKAEFGLVS